MKFSSPFWLVFELLLIAAPLTALFAAMAAPALFSRAYPNLPLSVVLQLIIVLTTTAIVCGWYLAYVFLRRGKRALSGTSNTPWIFASLGLCIALLSTLSNYLPRSEPYSALDMFRTDFGNFQTGLLFGLPLLHLWFERKRV